MTTTNQNENQPEETEADLVREPEGEGWIFTELHAAVTEGAAQLKKLPHLNPQSLRDFVVGDLYAIVADLIGAADYYISDLNNRLLDVEEAVGEDALVEYVDSTFLVGLLEFVGRTIHIGNKVATWASEKGDKEALENIQVLMATAPAVIARLQELLAASQEAEEAQGEEDDDEDEDEDEEEQENADAEEVQEPVRPVRSAAGQEEPDEKSKLVISSVVVTSSEPPEVTEVQSEPEAAPEPNDEAEKSEAPEVSNA
jgi:hypothetical protein